MSVALHEDAAFVVDAVQGMVRQLDPRSLSPVGEPVRFPPGITGGAFDGEGRLWIAVPSEGTVSAVTAATLPSAPASAAPAGGGLSPQRVETYDVAEASHELVVSTLDDGVAVLDRTAGSAGARCSAARSTRRRLTLPGPAALPARTRRPRVPVTVPDERQVLRGGRRRRGAGVRGAGQRRPAQPGGRLGGPVLLRRRGHRHRLLLRRGRPAGRDHQGQAGTGRWSSRCARTTCSSTRPDSSTARVVDDKHQVREVDKYANDVLGGDPPPAPPPPPPPPKKPPGGQAGRAAQRHGRGRQRRRPGSAGGRPPRTAPRSPGTWWRAPARRLQVGANQRALEVTGLTNGETYRFAVHAVNAKGDGPARSSNPVTPTSEVPDPPASVTARGASRTARSLVSWPAANGQGHKIARYAVTATSAGASAPAGESTEHRRWSSPAGELEYGTQYAFTVVAVNEQGAGSKASPVSNTVVPFTAPGRPRELRRGHGRPTRPARSRCSGSRRRTTAGRSPSTWWTAGGKTTEVTDDPDDVTGLGDGQNVTVEVKAVNEAGASGPEATATARTVAAPRVTVTGSSATATRRRCTFTVDAGGGKATCSAGQRRRAGDGRAAAPASR